MSNEKNDKLIQTFEDISRIEPSAESTHRALKGVRQILQQESKQQHTWRIIMKSRTAKLAAASIILMAITLTTMFFNRLMSTAYAIEQTIEACSKAHFKHFGFYGSSDDLLKEAWLEYDDSGQIKNVRVNFHYSEDSYKILIWKQGRTQYWSEQANSLTLFEDEFYTQKTINFAKRYDPATALENILLMEEKGDVAIEIYEPDNKNDPITLTAIYEPNAYLTEGTISRMKEIFFINQTTKLVDKIEVYGLKDEQADFFGYWQYQDYDIVFDPNIFKLEIELPSDVNIIDMALVDIGLEQCGLTNEQIAVKVVREFFKALIAKDYKTATKLVNHEDQKAADRIRENLEKVNVESIISIGNTFVPTFDKPKSHLVIAVPCVLEIEKDGQVVEWESDVYVSRVIGHPNRWVVEDFKNP